MHRSRLTAALIDVPAALFDAQVAFWSAALGRAVGAVSAATSEFAELEGLSSGLEVMVQRVGEGAAARVHLDIETDDVEAEVRRLEDLGAVRVEQVKTWWVMRDPAGCCSVWSGCSRRRSSPDPPRGGSEPGGFGVGVGVGVGEGDGGSGGMATGAGAPMEECAVAYRSMDAAEVSAFLRALPVRTGKLATVRADGRPHVAPVWYEVDDDGALVFNTGESTVKGRNLLRQGWASLCVDDERPPFSFVVVEGPVEITDAVEEVRHWAARIGGRYMGADRADEYGARNGVAGELLVRLRPERVVSAMDLAD
jgi:hypothetical protein